MQAFETYDFAFNGDFDRGLTRVLAELPTDLSDAEREREILRAKLFFFNRSGSAHALVHFAFGRAPTKAF